VFPAAIDEEAFDVPSREIETVLVALGKFAGFRFQYPINRPDYQNEFVVFQGPSYFRAVSRGQNYGLSARDLAIDVAEPEGEEFPSFARFWIERASADANSIVVHALLHSPRISGAYRFGIYPGTENVFDVDLTLFPREPLAHIGLSALTSMFMFGSLHTATRADYRPTVHDSLGLAVHTRTGERIWRPLNNPHRLQVSGFVDRNPCRFGLIQRDRRFSHFHIREARYQTRPSVWIARQRDWARARSFWRRYRRTRKPMTISLPIGGLMPVFYPACRSRRVIGSPDQKMPRRQRALPRLSAAPQAARLMAGTARW
jgi:glucans biosynthesis protein